MNDTYVKSHWSELKTKVKARWNKLTDEDLNAADGRVDQVCNKIRDRYGISDADAKRQFEQFTEGLENQGEAAMHGAGGQGSQGRQQTSGQGSGGQGGGQPGGQSGGQGGSRTGGAGQSGGTGQGTGGSGGFPGTTKPTERERNEGAG